VSALLKPVSPASLERPRFREVIMAAWLLVLLLVALLFGLGFVVKALLWVAIVVALLWIIGFFIHGTQAHWYRW